MDPPDPAAGVPPMTAPPPARTLDFGASATASLLVKMTVTFGMNERRDQMITYSLFGKLMRNEMPQNQGELDATLLIEDKRENLIRTSRAAGFTRSWSRTSDWVNISQTQRSNIHISTQLHHCFPTGTQSLQLVLHSSHHLCAASSRRAPCQARHRLATCWSPTTSHLV